MSDPKPKAEPMPKTVGDIVAWCDGRLSARARNVLDGVGIDTPVADIVTHPRGEWVLLVERGCGSKTDAEIKNELARYGLRIGMSKRDLNALCVPTLDPPTFPRGEWPEGSGDEPTTQSCWSCRYWKRYGDHPLFLKDDDTIGGCHRAPPTGETVLEDMEDGTTWESQRFPVRTFGADWCGEWRHWEATT